jgi:putative membrane protein|tara:strand:- start:3674 stop:4054 length:381 start_codon:yes stop_codon:yes gene_type:complete
MAGSLYLPRIFVYHVENSEKKETTEIFETMERRLYFYIMRPAMLATWLFGIILIYINGIDVFSELWMNIKLALVILLTIYHEYLGICLKSLKLKTNTKTPKFFRIINEVPTIILIFIIFIVIFKPI